jgi:radical SAM protein with 4Fe4S-binding SPASM domain
MEPYFTSIPQSPGVEITNRCNLACRHCFNRSGEEPVQELSLADVVYLFDQLQAMGLTSIRISGGEPTCHPDFAAIARAAVARGLQVSLNTNGLYPARLRPQLADLEIALFLVSLDGLREANDQVRGRGVFDQVVKTARWLRSLGRAVTLSVHLNRSNVGDIAGLIALAADLGADIKFAPLRPIGRARAQMAGEILTPADFYAAVQTITHVRTLYPGIRISTDFDILTPVSKAPGWPAPARASCPAGRTMLNVNCDGYVYPCAFLVTPQRELAAGHLHQAPLLTLWQESPVFQLFRQLPKSKLCQSCFAYGQTCVGGCPAIAYFTTGRLDTHDPTCFIEYVS